MNKYTEFLYLFAAAMLLALVLSVDDVYGRPTAWSKATASYYTLYGNRTACGLTMNAKAWHVASLTREHARCGRRVTICHRRSGVNRCVRVRVMDRGKFRSDGRMWDLTPRVKRALRCPDLCTVTWKSRW
jgi:hypothetical protein